MKQYVLIRALKVQGANAISGPLTYGIPSMTAFLGFGHALQRGLVSPPFEGRHQDLKVHGVGISVHKYRMLDHAEKYERTLKITANPLDEKGSRPSFIEEGRIHLTVSVLLEVSGVSREVEFGNDATEFIYSRLKLAGGDILEKPKVEFVADDVRGVRRLMPGYVLLDRRDLLKEEMDRQAESYDALEALHRVIALNSECDADNADNGVRTIHWRSSRAFSGWLVPIAVGYQALTPVVETSRTRDDRYPHRFAECVTSVGEFVMASRLDSLSCAIWRHQHIGEMYLVGQ